MSQDPQILEGDDICSIVAPPARAAAMMIPAPRLNISVRPATLDDLSFIDGLQRKHTKEVGYFPTKQFEGKIKQEHVIIAEVGAQRVGYLIGNDQYFKHDDIGVIYQLNVVPEYRRSLVAAMLLKAQFER